MPDRLFTWDEIRNLRAVVPHHVVHREFAAETVLLNINTGYYHGMDAIGGRFFAELRGAPTVSAAVATLATEYEQPAERIRDDMTRFCEELDRLGLLEFEAPI